MNGLRDNFNDFSITLFHKSHVKFSRSRVANWRELKRGRH